METVFLVKQSNSDPSHEILQSSILDGTKSSSNKVTLWSIQSDDLELIAGMLAGATSVLVDVNSRDKLDTYYADSTADVSAYRKLVAIGEEEIAARSVGQLNPGEYGIWLRSDYQFRYNLYGFRTASFMQGLVSFCTAFQIDFRDYTYGIPFDMNGNQYIMSGYIMTQFQVGVDAPDLNDVEIEEADDENIIEPLRKDD